MGRSGNNVGSIGKLYNKNSLSPFYTRICNKNPRKILPRIIKNSLRLKILKNFTKCTIFNYFCTFTLSFRGSHGSNDISKFSAHHPAHESARKTVRKHSPDFLKIVEV